MAIYLLQLSNLPWNVVDSVTPFYLSARRESMPSEIGNAVTCQSGASSSRAARNVSDFRDERRRVAASRRGGALSMGGGGRSLQAMYRRKMQREVDYLYQQRHLSALDNPDVHNSQKYGDPTRRQSTVVRLRVL
jgi:hypothetical protein